MSIAFYGERQTREHIMALHGILTSFGLIKSETRAPAPGSNEAIVHAYAHILGVEVHDFSWDYGARAGIIVEAPDAKLWIMLRDVPEAPYDYSAELSLGILDATAASRELERIRQHLEAKSAGGDRW
jgi:hypothetical protein